MKKNHKKILITPPIRLHTNRLVTLTTQNIYSNRQEIKSIEHKPLTDDIKE